MTHPPAACRFAARCPFVADVCTKTSPPLAMVSPGHVSRCLRTPLERLVS
jgi:peptide/nickel transport system ATP-binding protein